MVVLSGLLWCGFAALSIFFHGKVRLGKGKAIGLAIAFFLYALACSFRILTAEEMPNLDLWVLAVTLVLSLIAGGTLLSSVARAKAPA